jgi:hypothetical protein
MNEFQRRCPLCSGEMIRSRSANSGYTSYFWKKPWKTGFFLWGVEKIYPWACMGCGVVLLYLDRLPAVAEEYRRVQQGQKETSRSIEPAPLKS